MDRYVVRSKADVPPEWAIQAPWCVWNVAQAMPTFQCQTETVAARVAHSLNTYGVPASSKSTFPRGEISSGGETHAEWQKRSDEQ